MEECVKDYYEDGNIYREEYYKGEDCHRDNLPAVIYYNKDGSIYSESYYKEGFLHREDGPARIYYFENGKVDHQFYILNGIFYTDKEIIDNWKAFCSIQIFR